MHKHPRSIYRFDRVTKCVQLCTGIFNRGEDIQFRKKKLYERSKYLSLKSGEKWERKCEREEEGSVNASLGRRSFFWGGLKKSDN